MHGCFLTGDDMAVEAEAAVNNLGEVRKTRLRPFLIGVDVPIRTEGESAV